MYFVVCGAGEHEFLVFAALEDLVEETGYARSTVAAARRALVDEGWLVLAVQGRQHRADLYDLIDYEDYNHFDTSVFNFQIAR